MVANPLNMDMLREAGMFRKVFPATGQWRQSGVGGASRRAVSLIIPGGQIKGGDRMDIAVIFNRPRAGAAGAPFSIFIQPTDRSAPARRLLQTDVQTNTRAFYATSSLFISTDRRWGFEYSLNALNQASMAAS